MKYWFLDLEVTQGYTEYHAFSVHKGKTFDEYEYTSYFFGDSEELEEGVYSFDNNNMIVKIYKCEKISKKDYDVLKKYVC
jgi:hypothetical protein